MPALIEIRTDGTRVTHQVKKLDLAQVRKLIGPKCDIVERIRVKYAGHVRDCWLDEEGLYKGGYDQNPYVRKLAEEHYKMPMQTFMGTGVIWVPGNTLPSDDCKVTS